LIRAGSAVRTAHKSLLLFAPKIKFRATADSNTASSTSC
jgi:hypothetical protein